MREPLTKTELDVLGLLDQGMTNREIASSLSMKLGTIKWYLAQIFAKLQARNRVEALMKAHQLKWVSSLNDKNQDWNTSAASFLKSGLAKKGYKYADDKGTRRFSVGRAS